MLEPHKSLAISADETDDSQLSLADFRLAIEKALEGKKFDAMVFFSCLTNMVEVGYGLRDLTSYIVASQDEIRIVNHPPGKFQIRGIKLEEPIRAMQSNPLISMIDFGKITIDTFMDQYTRDLKLIDRSGQPYTCRYSAALAFVDCRNFGQLANYLNSFADYVRKRLRSEEHTLPLLDEIRSSLDRTQRFPSFLNLEYYDVQDFLLNLAAQTRDIQLQTLCRDIVAFIKNKVIVYEKHTNDCESNGLSIYLSNYLIPDNIFQSHQAMYRRSKFCEDTSWDEMIDVIRSRMRAHR